MHEKFTLFSTQLAHDEQGVTGQERGFNGVLYKLWPLLTR